MKNEVIADSGQQDDTKKGLDNTSHSGRPESGELVPSRYALRVGEIDVLVVSDGVLPIAAETIASNVDATVRTAWLDDMFLPPDMLEWPLNVVVVRSGGRTILVDAGLGADPKLHLPQAGRPNFMAAFAFSDRSPPCPSAFPRSFLPLLRADTRPIITRDLSHGSAEHLRLSRTFDVPIQWGIAQLYLAP